jgi:mRNA interferase MazF
VLSRDAAIAARGRLLVAPCTTHVRGLPSEVELHPDADPVPRPCVVTLDAVESVGTRALVERLGRLDDMRMRELCAALAVAVDCPASPSL